MTGRDRLAVAWLPTLLCAAMVLTVLWFGPARAAPRTAVVIALDMPIGPGTAAYVVRGLHAAERQQAAVVVLRLDTPGGLDSAMRDIIRAMLASPVPVIAYVAPSGARAASAGTYILYAAALAAMAPGTNLGAAAPVSLFGPTPLAGTEKKPPVAPRDAMLTKVTNDSAAYIRGLAAMHGRNAAWAETAVREAVSLPYDAALDQHVIEIVAADLPNLLAQADGHSVVAQGKTVRLATRRLDLVAIEPNWRDQLLGLLTDPTVVYVLLLTGVVGVAFELSYPGVYAPGVIGAICLLVGGYGLNLLPIGYAGVALTLMGLGLMTAEAFVPSFGAFVLGGAVAFGIGSVMMVGASDAHPPLALIIGATAVCALLFGVVLSLLLRARLRPVATGTTALVGLRGRAIAWAGSEGEVIVQGERWRASAAQPLEPGATVRVVGRSGLTLIVEAV